MPSPSPPSLTQIITNDIQALDQFIKQVTPLLEAAFAFSQVLGKLMASEDDTGPPSTYYIADPDPSSPTPPGTQAPTGQGYTSVAALGVDQAAGFPLAGTDFGVYMGPGMSSVALAVSSSANGSTITSGNPTILVGSGSLPLAGVGSSVATGNPIIDQFDESVQMSMPLSHSPTGQHLFYTVQGTTAQPGDCENGAYPGMMATDPRVMQYFKWMQVIYPAATFPMGPSVQAGVQNLVSQISGNQGTFAFCGYSQGAIVTCKVWRDEILNPQGQLHDRLADFFAHVTYGNPLRCPGYANGNALAGIPFPVPLEGYVVGGIAGPDDLTPWQVPTWQMDFAHDGDMYASCPVGADPWQNESPVGQAETSIYDFMMLQVSGQDSLIPEIGELLTNPLPTGIAIIEGLVNTIGFFSQGMSAPHYTYQNDGCVEAATEWLVKMGQGLPA